MLFRSPVNQGKSHFCVVEHQTLGTVEVSGWSFFQDALAGRPPKPGDLPPGPDYRLTIIDTPGDFLGAQLRTVMRYRTDVLVLVVAADTLNPEKLNQDGEKILDLFKEAIVTPSSFSAKLIGARSSEETKSALGTGREYVASLVNALKMGRETKKDAGGNDRETIVTAQDLYAVKKFLLFINAPIGTRADLAGGLQKCANLQKIADELGGLFGCTGPKRVVIGDANTPLDGRDNLFLGWPSVPIPIANSVPPKKKSGIGTLGDSKTDGGTSHSAPPTPLVP